MKIYFSLTFTKIKENVDEVIKLFYWLDCFWQKIWSSIHTWLTLSLASSCSLLMMFTLFLLQITLFVYSNTISTSKIFSDLCWFELFLCRTKKTNRCHVNDHSHTTESQLPKFPADHRTLLDDYVHLRFLCSVVFQTSS